MDYLQGRFQICHSLLLFSLRQDEFSHLVQEWNNQRMSALARAFNGMLYPLFEKELKAKLLEESKNFVIKVRFQSIKKLIEILLRCAFGNRYVSVQRLLFLIFNAFCPRFFVFVQLPVISGLYSLAACFAIGDSRSVIKIALYKSCHYFPRRQGHMEYELM